MIKKQIFLLWFLIFCNSLFAMPWPQTTKNDLIFIKQQLTSQTPGAIDAENPFYKNWLETGFQKGLTQANHASDKEKYIAILQKYIDGFQDQHVVVYFNEDHETKFPPEPNNFSVNNFGANQLWVSIPTFNANDKTDLQALRKLVQQASHWRTNKLLVLDVRGNGGGNSIWGEKILKNLYGNEYFDYAQQLTPDKSYTQWRVSPQNLKFLKEVDLAYIKNSLGKNSYEYKYIQTLIDKMQQNLKTLEPWVTMPNDAPKRIFKTAPKNPVTAKVLLVTDRQCGSSCITFVEQALNIPDIIQVGAPTTHEDTNYSEIRYEQLPSGKGRIGFPIKVDRDRNRPAYQPFVPSYIYSDNIKDTESLKKWITENSSSFRRRPESIPLMAPGSQLSLG